MVIKVNEGENGVVATAACRRRHRPPPFGLSLNVCGQWPTMVCTTMRV